jgi:hypothetical protein
MKSMSYEQTLATLELWRPQFRAIRDLSDNMGMEGLARAVRQIANRRFR